MDKEQFLTSGGVKDPDADQESEDEANSASDKTLESKGDNDDTSTAADGKLSELKELLEDVGRLEATMMETKRGYEAFYKNLRLTLHQKVKIVSFMEKEIKWLTRECEALERSCKDIGVLRGSREEEMKKCLGRLMDIDVEKAAADLPSIYRKYIQLRTADECKQLLDEVETTTKSLCKFEQLIKAKQQKLTKGDNSKQKNRATSGDAFLKNILEKLTGNLGLRMDAPDGSSTSLSNLREVTSTQPDVTLASSNMAAAQPTLEVSDNPHFPSTANGAFHSPRIFGTSMADHWLGYRDPLNTTIPPPSLLSDILNAEELLADETQLSECDALQDDFNIIL